MPAITAVCRVARLRPDSGNVGVTAIDKTPLDEPVAVRKLGVYGDVQADRTHHGGADKAVYAFSDEDAAHFAGLLGREIAPGLFGENLRTTGVDVGGAVIGERWRIGDALVLEVTMPRTPCATFARRMKEPRWVKRFTAENRTGAYLRVVSSGSVSAGDPVIVTDRPSHGITIAECFAGLSPDRARLLVDAADGGSFVAQPVLDVAVKALRRVSA
ncbi:MOSC domain-containing protein YiiM [Frondihabitans sp. PhB188]|uniref:MOSC domain-containing protein n=1 Tax=Frondihabitans sp. PhB188 TaxID=2485200 RepID=UPI000F491D35|nr:MOSC domain-containing protein [Frondihabitans sp. PhB188]ROQ39603.1 MOSC domain-containing protein YiiM [Frondihabitans sp. PhB188]